MFSQTVKPDFGFFPMLSDSSPRVLLLLLLYLRNVICNCHVFGVYVCVLHPLVYLLHELIRASTAHILSITLFERTITETANIY